MNPFAEAQQKAIVTAMELIAELEENPGDGKLLREAQKVLRDLLRPRQKTVIPKSEEALRWQAQKIRMAVAVNDATEQ